MRRTRLLVAGIAALSVVTACTSASQHPQPAPSTSIPSSGSASTSASATPAKVDAENPALNRCDDLGFLPCARQVAQFSLPVAGSNISLTYSSDRQPGRKLDPAPPAGAIGLGGWTVSVLDSLDPNTKTLVTGTGTVRRVTGTVTPAGLEVADLTGRLVDLFDAAGRQTETLDAATGSPMLSFQWDANGLASVSDLTGIALKVVRAADGTPRGLQVPGGAATSIGTLLGRIAAVSYPDGTLAHVTTDKQGLLVRAVDAAGVGAEFAYDADGRLTSSTDGTGARTNYRRQTDGSSLTVVSDLAGGGKVSDGASIAGPTTTWTHTDASGSSTTIAATGQQRTIGLPDGRSLKLALAPDPRFGPDAPVVSSFTDGASTRSEDVTAKVRKVTIDNRTWTFGYDPNTRTTTSTDPGGVGQTAVFDAKGRVVRQRENGLDTAYAYNADGRLASVTLGTGPDARTWTYTYDSNSRVTITDPVGGVQIRTTTPTGALAAISGPGSSGLELKRDAAGRLDGFATPGGATWSYTLRADGAVAALNSPAGQGGPQFTGYDYDTSGLVSKIFTGSTALSVQRNAGGQVTGYDAGNGVNTATYDSAARLSSWTNAGLTVTEGYTGAAVTKESVSGTIAGIVSRTVDAQGRTSLEDVNGQNPVKYTYDSAGRLTAAGDLSIVRDSATGRVTSQTLGSLTTTWTTNQFGETTGEQVTGPGGTGVAGITYQRDKLGRVTEVATTVAGKTSTSDYRYDASGRLQSESTDGTATSYAYDAAGNLMSVTAGSGTPTKFTYDARNALISRGDTRYSYDGAGRLATATSPAGLTSYNYDALGDLVSVKQPGKPEINYTVDGFGRRAATSVGGKVVSGLLYRDPTRPAAELDATGAVTKRYVYSGFSPLPAYVTTGGKNYLEMPDVTGGPGLVLDSTTGAVVYQIQRTAFGVVKKETSPGFQAIGFGGGIADPATGLVRFGARDFDTASGRWTAPDPLGVGGGSANLYEFVGGDPVNRSDVTGTSCDYLSIGVSYGGGIGPAYGGGSIGIAFSGGQVGTYTTFNSGVGYGAGGGAGIQCMDKDDGSAPSLNDFSGMGRSGEVSVGPVTAGTDKGYNSSGDPSSHGWHFGVGPNSGVGGAVTQGITSILCLTGCPPPPICVNGICDPNPSPASQPSDPCAGFPCADPPSSGSPFGRGARSTGDPHLRTADNTYYDMQGAGEYMALTSDTGDFTVQVRQEPMPDSGVALTTAVALSLGGDRLSVTQTGQTIAVKSSTETLPAAGTFRLTDGAKLMLDEKSLVITLPDGSLLGVSTNPRGLNVNATMTDARIGHVHGLLGPYTGQVANTVVAKNGTSFTTDQLRDYDTLYRKFADTWRITQAQSLFTYPAGKNTGSYTDLNFPPRTPAAISAAARQAAEEICRQLQVPDAALPGCIQDVALTGDARFAATMARDTGSVPGAPAGQSSVSGAISPGQTVSGTLAAGASKTYPFTVTAGTVAYFSAAKGCTTQGIYWNVFMPDGTPMGGTSKVCNDLGRIRFVKPGDYLVKVFSQDGGAGEYAVIWTASRPDITRTLTPGQQVAGAVDKPGARDIYTFSVTANTVGYFAASPDCKRLDGDAQVRWIVQDPDGYPFIGNNVICDDLGRVVFKKPGTYSVVVSSDAGATGPYSFSWVESRPDVTRQLTAGAHATATIDKPGARDVYTMAVTAGTVAYFSAAPGCVAGDDKHQLRWTVEDPDGYAYIGNNRICDTIGRVQFKISGTYRLVVYSDAGGTGPYGLTWTASRPDAIVPMTIGTSINGHIDLPGAHDIWTFAVSRPGPITLKAAAGCTTSPLRWRVVDGQGYGVVGTASMCEDLGKIALPAAGAYAVEVSGTDDATGSYSFRSS